jgi:CDP-glycerol glycerophosphotransferase (TagB/SpsB family)
MIKTIVRKWVMRTVELLMGGLALIIPKNARLIVLGAHNGHRFGDNTAYVFDYLNKHEKQLMAVWLTDNPRVVKELRAKHQRVYYRRSLQALWYSLRTPLVLCTHNIKDAIVFIPFRNRPVVGYLHHGIPLRKGWLDSQQTSPQQQRSVKEKIKAATFMIAPSVFAAEQQNKMFPVGLERFKIIGLPRNDNFFPDDPAKLSLQVKQLLGLKATDRTILYAPTWRPWGATRFFPFAASNLSQLNTLLKSQETYLLLRPHHIDLENDSLQDFWQSLQQYSQLIIATHDQVANVNQLCLISDALITDYSSLYYDYLLLDRPVIFLAYDRDRYEAEIGFYPDYDDITIGEHPDNWQEFLQAINAVINQKDPHRSRRNAFRDRFHHYRDGHSTKRLVEVLKMILDEKL